MKILILIFLIVLLNENISFSQNALSDAVLISKNRITYSSQIKNIINNATLDGKQKEDLENLDLFLRNPWDDKITNLNFKIFLDIPKIISGLSETKETIESGITLLKEDLGKKNLLLLKLIQDSLNISIDSIALKNSLRKQISELNSEIPETILNITANEVKLKEIGSLQKNPNEFKDFQNSIENQITAINMLGKDNSQEIKENVSNASFSISQAAIMEALGNAIIEQVREGLVNLLFESILENDIELVKDSADLILNYPNGTICTNSIVYNNGKKYVLKIPIKNSNEKKIDTIFIGNNIQTIKLKNELRVFFPRTIDVLERLKESKTNNYFTNINLTLKENFSDDLKNILENITNENNMKESIIFRKYFYKSDLKTKKELYNYLNLSIELVQNFKNGFHPIELLTVLNKYLENYENSYFNDFGRYINLIDVLQKNLRDVSPNSKQIWASLNSLDELNTKTYSGTLSSAEFFMGILYQITKYKGIKEKFVPNGVFINAEFDRFKKNLSSEIVLLRSIENNISELSNGNNKSFSSYVHYLNNFMRLLDTTNVLLGNYFFDTEVTKKIDNYIDTFNVYSGYSIEIYKSITNGTYSKIIPITLEIFDNEFRLAQNNEKFKNEFLRYANLYVDISTATSQNDLNSAINKAAHNSGGYLRKSEEDFNVSIDSYPGIFICSEKINNRFSKPNFGFSVPLGFNFQLQRFGLYLQAFDIAAAVNYRFTNDGNTTNLPADVTFQQVFSPGIFFVFNPMPKFPLSFNVGLAVTPALREVSGTGVTLENSKSTFFGVYVSYNVPLWYLY